MSSPPSAAVIVVGRVVMSHVVARCRALWYGDNVQRWQLLRASSKNYANIKAIARAVVTRRFGRPKGARWRTGGRDLAAGRAVRRTDGRKGRGSRARSDERMGRARRVALVTGG